MSNMIFTYPHNILSTYLIILDTLYFYHGRNLFTKFVIWYAHYLHIDYVLKFVV